MLIWTASLCVVPGPRVGCVSDEIIPLYFMRAHAMPKPNETVRRNARRVVCNARCDGSPSYDLRACVAHASCRLDMLRTLVLLLRGAREEDGGPAS
jgi:hypothetical protein